MFAELESLRGATTDEALSRLSWAWSSRPSQRSRNAVTDRRAGLGAQRPCGRLRDDDGLSGREEVLGKGDEDAGGALLAIGLFGFLFTLGLFAYELFGIKKCHYLIAAGARLEHEIGVPGQFRSRPRAIAGRVNEPFASAIIYPASMAAWIFLALAVMSELAAALAAVAVFAAGAIGTYKGAEQIKLNEEREDLVRTVVGDGQTLEEVRDEVARRWAQHCAPADAKGGATAASATWVNKVVERLVREGELRRSHRGGQEHLEPSSGARWDTPQEPATA